MNSGTYKVMFEGQVLDGFELKQVKAALGERLRIAPEQIERLFCGRRVRVKENIEKETAEKYVAVFKACGARAHIEGEVPPPEPALVPTGESEAPQMDPASAWTLADDSGTEHEAPQEAPTDFACPKCGYKQMKSEECVSCGIIFARYRPPQSADSIKSYPTLRRERAGPQSRRPSLTSSVTEAAPEWLLSSLVEWIRGNALTALVVLVLLPIFAGGIIINAVFYTRDHHVLYQQDQKRLVCGDLTPDLGPPGPNMRMNPRDDAIGHQWMVDYLGPKKQFYEDDDGVYCVVEYKFSVGSIGDEMVEYVDFVFDQDKLPGIFLDGQPLAHIRKRVLNISSGEPRASDPEFENVGDATLRIKALAPGTVIDLEFRGWYKPDEEPYQWDVLLHDVRIAEGAVEYGDPRGTVLARMIASIF